MATFLKLEGRSTPTIVAVWVPDHENDENGEDTSVKSSKLVGAKPKKKCCRSKPRCKRCPLVLSKVNKAQLSGIRGKDLDKVFQRARKS